ncbi:U2 small nuclear ribonucleoprotein auxiliary factor 35 kDa subunit-related protein 1 [Entelurus aequoreus]|uniref:U2 small nuclear ribonucleoprotein auxiliary factor 35 kDa subunit-related protein 1 n=1 Tax=Entelurus aequoreus TaxID=161455 RepID=UPI002B1DAB72|nr:U2 small nuclear ribonucleoprotein auxiliary factor 35 kDa subunit-related protein 1 [Entelurus aequoreus]XP_061890491.1 U2 small nuclear ribonucleoprotein auxiliary factor 35 kDa subunit-related protein 1 [Entelurus aequoreus]
MAASIPPLSAAPAFNQKQRRAASRKERRKRKRQAIAQARQCALHNGATVDPPDEEEDDEEEEEEEEASIVEKERQRLHEEWLQRERLAQEEFRLKSERKDAARKRKEDEERCIKEEWEAQQRQEEEEKEQKLQEKRGRKEAAQKMLDEAEHQLNAEAPWMNPEAPKSEKSEHFGTERDAANCPFFLKTGACRFGDRCSRKHISPTSSPTLMIRNMFLTFGMEQSRRDDYDGDACLEHSEEDLQESFTEFYHDVLPEFRSVGKVVQFKVSCNYEPHLRGNVYVQFDTEQQCRDALIKFNGRFYAGKQLHCQICPVTRWKNAICGLFDRNRCPKGKHCNFLHVFRNPANEFWEADRDLNLSPDHSVRGSHSERTWRHRQRSSSPPRSLRSHRRTWHRRDTERSARSRSPDIRSRSPDTRSRSRDIRSRSPDIRSRSRDTRSRSPNTRSRSPDIRSRSPDTRSRSPDIRSRSPDIRSRSPDTRSRSPNTRSRSRDTRSREKDSKKQVRNNGKDENGDRRHSWSRDAERSKERREKKVGLSPERKEGKQGRRHKHSKKSKKKSKKRSKKRSSSAEDRSSSSGHSHGDQEDLLEDNRSDEQEVCAGESHKALMEGEQSKKEDAGEK